MRWSRMSAAIGRLADQVTHTAGRADLLMLLDLVEQLNDERSAADARITAALHIHKQRGPECESCTKTIGGMTRVVAWPCATVKALMGHDQKGGSDG